MGYKLPVQAWDASLGKRKTAGFL